MKLRTSLLVGFVAGYVLGSKAGRERYEQIVRVVRGIAENPPVKQVIAEARDLADSGTVKARETVGDHLRDASQAIREKTG